MATTKTRTRFCCSFLFLIASIAFCEAQERSELSRKQIFADSSVELAEGYLDASYKAMAAAHVIRTGVAFHTTVGGVSVTITKENASKILPKFNEQVEIYKEAIRTRGYRKLPQTFLAQTGENCDRFGLQSGPVLIDQDGFQIMLSQSGMSHRGVLVESVVAIEHYRSTDIHILGDATDEQIDCHIKLRGFAATSQPVGCKLVLRKPVVVGREFAVAYFDRAHQRLGNNDYAGAIVDLDEAIRLEPEFAMAFSLRSQLRSAAPDRNVRNGPLAVEDAKKACALTDWKNWQCMAPLASAYAEDGDFESAAKWISKALESAPKPQQGGLQAALDSFRARRPLRLNSTAGILPESSQPKELDWLASEESSGVSLEFVCKQMNDQFKVCSLKLTGVDATKKLELWHRKFGGGWTKLYDVVIDGQGLLSIQTDGKESVIQFVPGGFGPGEHLHLSVVSSDRSIKTSASLAPNPLEARDEKSGYGLEAELLGVEGGGMYSVEISGFEPGEEVREFSGQLGSDLEIEVKRFTVGKDRTPVTIVLPAVYGRAGGIATFRAVGRKGQVVLELPWGDRLVPADASENKKPDSK